jgi:hypothetical protein
MTSSPEKHIDEARQALNESKRAQVVYSAVQGRICSGADTSRKLDVDSEATHLWTEAGSVAELVNTAFSTAPEERAETFQRVATPATFLYAVLQCAWSPERRQETPYTYLGKGYRLRSEKEPDPEMGRRFAGAGLTSSPGAVMQIRATVLDSEGRKGSRFRFWVEDAEERQLPLRFEYKARSFLRVAFERDPAQEPGRLALGGPSGPS